MKSPSLYTARPINPAHVEELSHLQCGNPACQDPTCDSVLVVVPVCHPTAGVQAQYHKNDGTLRVACGRCERLVLAVKVANLPKEKMT